MSTCFRMVKNYLFFQWSTPTFSVGSVLAFDPIPKWSSRGCGTRPNNDTDDTEVLGMRRRAEKIVCVCFLQNSDLMYSRILGYIYIHYIIWKYIYIFNIINVALMYYNCDMFPKRHQLCINEYTFFGKWSSWVLCGTLDFFLYEHLRQNAKMIHGFTIMT